MLQKRGRTKNQTLSQFTKIKKVPLCDLHREGSRKCKQIFHEIELKMRRDGNITPLCDLHRGRNEENQNLSQ